MIERGAAFASPKGDLGSIGSKKQLEAIAQDEKYFIDKHECVKDIVKNSASSVDTRLWYVWADNSAEAVDWYTDLLEKNGYTMWLEASVGTPGGRDKAWPTGHSPAANSAETLGIADVLKNYTDSLGGTAMTETTLIKLVKNGERFCNESGLIESGHVIKADTIEELAEKLGLPVENLVKSVERYNELEAKGHDDDFGKVAYRLSRIDTPPYYGVRCSAWHLCTLDGVLINQNMQAITPNHDPIEVLYVVGDASGATLTSGAVSKAAASCFEQAGVAF